MNKILTHLLLSVILISGCHSVESKDTEKDEETAAQEKDPRLTGDPQKDWEFDPNLPRELRGYNMSDFPFFSRVPNKIEFDCTDRIDGFYANRDYKCQVYHHCLYGIRQDFLCANYTAFDMRTFICQFINVVDCENSDNYTYRNEPLYKTTTTVKPKRKPFRTRLEDYDTDYYYDDYYYDDYYYEDSKSKQTTTTTTSTTTTTTLRPFRRRGGRPRRPNGTRRGPGGRRRHRPAFKEESFTEAPPVPVQPKYSNSQDYAYDDDYVEEQFTSQANSDVSDERLRNGQPISIEVNSAQYRQQATTSVQNNGRYRQNRPQTSQSDLTTRNDQRIRPFRGQAQFTEASRKRQPQLQRQPVIKQADSVVKTHQEHRLPTDIYQKNPKLTENRPQTSLNTDPFNNIRLRQGQPARSQAVAPVNGNNFRPSQRKQSSQQFSNQSPPPASNLNQPSQYYNGNQVFFAATTAPSQDKANSEYQHYDYYYDDYETTAKKSQISREPTRNLNANDQSQGRDRGRASEENNRFSAEIEPQGQRYQSRRQSGPATSPPPRQRPPPSNEYAYDREVASARLGPGQFAPRDQQGRRRSSRRTLLRQI